MRTAHLTLVLCLLLAVVWRTRDRFPFAGLALGVALGAQVLPLAARALARRAATVARRSARRLLRRRHAPARAAVHLAARVRDGSCAGSGRTFDQDSFTPFGLLSQLGASDRVAQVVALALGIARPRDRLAPAELRPLRRRGADAVADRLARLLRGARRPARGRPAAAVGRSGCCPSSPGESRRPATGVGHVGDVAPHARGLRRCSRSSSPAASGEDEIRAQSPVRREAAQRHVSAPQACPRRQRR